MAISYAKDGILKFFTCLSPVAESLAKEFLAAGGTIAVEFHAIKLSKNGKTFAVCPLGATSSSIIKGASSDYAVQTTNTSVVKALKIALGIQPASYSMAAGDYSPLEPPKIPTGVGLSFDPQGNPVTPSKKDATNIKDELIPDPVAAKDNPLSSKEDSISDKQKAKLLKFADTYGGNVKNIIYDFDYSKVEAQTVITLLEKLPDGVKEKVLQKINPEAPPVVSVPTVPIWPGGIVNPGKLITLRKATFLNEPVKGTDAGSIYRVIAIGKRAKMAARLKANNLSVRVEGDLNLQEATELTSFGFSKSTSGHYSIHLQLGSCPVWKVIGCILMLPLEWMYKINSMKEVQLG